MEIISKNKMILSIIIGIVIFAVLLYFSNIREIISILSKINPIWIIFIIMIYSIGWLLRGYRWKIILRSMDYIIKLKDSISLVILGNFANLITPAKIGDFVRAFVLKRNDNVDISKGISSVVVDRILDFFGVAILAYVSLSMISKDLSLPSWANILTNNSIYIMISGFIIIGMVSKINISEKYLYRINAVGKVYKKFVSPLFENIKTVYRPIEMTKLCIISIAIWLFDISTVIILLYSLGYFVNIPLIISAVMIANMTKVLPLTPGGIGAYEGAFAAIFMVGGLPYTLGLTIGILDHGIKNLYTIVFGILSLNYNGIRLRELERKTG